MIIKKYHTIPIIIIISFILKKRRNLFRFNTLQLLFSVISFQAPNHFLDVIILMDGYHRWWRPLGTRWEYLPNRGHPGHSIQMRKQTFFQIVLEDLLGYAVLTSQLPGVQLGVRTQEQDWLLIGAFKILYKYFFNIQVQLVHDGSYFIQIFIFSFGLNFQDGFNQKTGIIHIKSTL